MPYKDKAQAAEAQNKWARDALDHIHFTVPKGERERIKAHAGARGEKVNAFIRRAIAEQMERDKELADCKRYMETPNDALYEMLRRGVNVENLQDVSEEEKAAFLEKLKNQTEPVSCEEIYAVLKMFPDDESEYEKLAEKLGWR